MERPDEGAAEETIAERVITERPRGGTASRRLVITDSSRLFTMVAPLSWVALVAAPLLISATLDTLASGLPLVGVALWLALLRVARWLSPLTRADMLIQRGAFADALALCDETLGVSGTGAWVGSRRLAWLNRRFSALLGLGRYDVALTAAMDAMEISPDPETIANVALVLLRLNHYEGAVAAAREASALTHGRSVRANATLAWAMLARGQPAEAEALASVSLADIEALSPYVRRENHVASLSALASAQRALGLNRQAHATVARLRRITKQAPTLAAVTLLEDARLHADEPARAAEMVTFAFASDPVYTGWYLTQPDTLAFLRTAPEVGPLFTHSAEEMARMNAGTPDDEVIARLLASLRPEEHGRPTLQRSGSALNIQVILLAATLLLLLFWMWRFFVSQTF